MSTRYLKTLPARLVVLLGACLIALALFGGIGGAPLIAAGGTICLTGAVWFWRLWRA